MSSNNVTSEAKIIKSAEAGTTYELGQFLGTTDSNQVEHGGDTSLNDRDINGNIDPVLVEIKNLISLVNTISQKVIDIENDGIKGRDLDQQVIQALKDLKNYASFFEKATFQMETKILKTSISIAQKVIGIEVGENSHAIAKETISNMLEKIKTASKVTIHLNPKDFTALKGQLELDSFVQLQEDPNVTAGGVVVASDLGNFDGSIDVKVQTLLDSLNSVS
jgi:flagellar assembly protein FliH